MMRLNRKSCSLSPSGLAISKGLYATVPLFSKLGLYNSYNVPSLGVRLKV